MQQITQPITTYHTNLVALHKLHYAKRINHIYSIAAIREPTKNGYIKLTTTR